MFFLGDLNRFFKLNIFFRKKIKNFLEILKKAMEVSLRLKRLEMIFKKSIFAGKITNFRARRTIQNIKNDKK